MNVVLSIIYYICIVAFMFGYIVCFIINLIRAIKVNNSMKEDYSKVNAKVVEVIHEKNVYMLKWSMYLLLILLNLLIILNLQKNLLMINIMLTKN